MNTIKKFRNKVSFIVFFITILLSSKVFSLSLEYENELRNGCYINSKKYLGTNRAKEYCVCTIKMLSKKFNNTQIDELFKKKTEEITKETEFASIHCEENKKAF